MPEHYGNVENGGHLVLHFFEAFLGHQAQRLYKDSSSQPFLLVGPSVPCVAHSPCPTYSIRVPSLRRGNERKTERGCHGAPLSAVQTQFVSISEVMIQSDWLVNKFRLSWCGVDYLRRHRRKMTVSKDLYSPIHMVPIGPREGQKILLPSLGASGSTGSRSQHLNQVITRDLPHTLICSNKFSCKTLVLLPDTTVRLRWSSTI
ncbi:hypothetical protein EV363DRAFT_1396152 [Boletus edulis]|nr:hypothetical protein EV363DRAFT_1396152 [Boletus edulis]